jgi:hypothetical protein
MTYTDDKFAELQKGVRGKVAVYIDAANLEQSVKEMFVIPRDISDNFKSSTPPDLRWRVDYENLKGFFEQFGDASTFHYYTPEFATENHQKFRSFL